MDNINEGIIEYYPDRIVWKINEFDGVCDQCGGVLHFNDERELLCLKIRETDIASYAGPLNFDLTCPHCLRKLAIMRIWKSTDITKELEEINARRRQNL